MGSGTNEKTARDGTEAIGRRALMTKWTHARSGLSGVLGNKNQRANVAPAKRQDCVDEFTTKTPRNYPTENVRSKI